MRPILIGAVIASLSCTLDSRPINERTAIRDSAGVTIIENSEARWLDGQGWEFSQSPFLQIGFAHGDSAYQFHRITSALRLSDGRIVVSDLGSRQVRIFGSNGQLLHVSGRQGSGPGEYQAPWWLARASADTIIVYDYQLRRISVLDPDGTLVRNLSLAGSEVPADKIFPLEDGDFVATPAWNPSALPRDLDPGLYRPQQPIVRLLADGVVADTLALFPGQEISVSDANGERLVGPAPFGHALSVWVAQDTLYVGTGDALEIQVLGIDGRLRRKVRIPTTRVPIDNVDLEHLAESQGALLSSDRQRIYLRNHLMTAHRPKLKPAFSRLLVDPSGSVWLSPTLDSQFPREPWTIIDSDGSFLGTLVMPDGLEILEIGHDYVLGRWRDESNVEYIRVYSLSRTV